MRPSPIVPAAAICSLAAGVAYGQDWAEFQNETATRLIADSALVETDPEEKDYAWGDVDGDGDEDLIIVRKQPFTNPTGKRNVFLMNEGGGSGHPRRGEARGGRREGGSARIRARTDPQAAAAYRYAARP